MSENKQLYTLSLGRLDNSRLAQLLTDTKQALTSFTESHSSEEFYSNQNAAMSKELATFEGFLNRSYSSLITDQLRSADKERDDAVKTIVTLIRAHARVKTNGVQAAYKLLSQLIKPYKGMEMDCYEVESEKIRHFLKEIAKDTYESAIEQLHLTEHIEVLKKAQTQFETVYQSKLQEQKGKKTNQTAPIRKALVERYSLIMKYTAINMQAFPEKTELADLLANLTSIRNRYKTNKRKSSHSKEMTTKSE